MHDYLNLDCGGVVQEGSKIAQGGACCDTPPRGSQARGQGKQGPATLSGCDVTICSLRPLGAPLDYNKHTFWGT